MSNNIQRYDSDDEGANDETETASAIMESCAGFYSSYECKEVLGRGIASTVRRCVEKNTGQMFAVKIVDISTERQNEHEAKRLADETLSEVSLLRLLSGHPSIISIHDFYSTPTFLFAVFEMAPGGELFHLLNKSVTLSEKKTRQIMSQLFNGVSYMHNKSIVHRDLKLENVLCIDDRRVVISDFGFAKQLNPNERLKELFGTPGYLAPETLRCQMYEDATGYGVEVDNWALGVIMYTLLAGYAPFYHRQQLRMMRLIQEGKYEFSKEAWESISRDAKDLIRCLLTVDVTKRITADEAFQHPWMQSGIVLSRQASIRAIPVSVPVETVGVPRPLTPPAESRSKKRSPLFIPSFSYCRTRCIDRSELRRRPYRIREIRHEAEAAAFDVFGHWINRGFHYSRDMLFANKSRPLYVPLHQAVKSKE
ncbi:Phosphorylase kinase [Aphelenchoides besseyi]|nr:Phosphorylase kinase [Aphelenchoides besseyi]